jgi:hypothetical protein
MRQIAEKHYTTSFSSFCYLQRPILKSAKRNIKTRCKIKGTFILAGVPPALAILLPSCQYKEENGHPGLTPNVDS